VARDVLSRLETLGMMEKDLRQHIIASEDKIVERSGQARGSPEPASFFG
jgi:hypothetical protein